MPGKLMVIPPVVASARTAKFGMPRASVTCLAAVRASGALTETSIILEESDSGTINETLNCFVMLFKQRPYVILLQDKEIFAANPGETNKKNPKKMSKNVK